MDADIDLLQTDINTKKDAFQKVTLEFEKWKSTLETEIEHLRKELKIIENLEEQRKKNAEIQARIEKIEAKAGTIKEIQEKIKEEDAKLGKLSKQIDDKNGDIFFVEKELV